MLNVLIFAVAAALFGVISVWWGLSSPEKTEKREKLARTRWAGIVLGIPALIWCIPHAGAVAPDFLVPFFLPLAIGVPVAAFFVLDFIFARTVSGWAIILAYEIVHRTFEITLPGAPAFAVMAWILGLAGIWFSGIPHHFRDAIRLAAQKSVVKWLATGYFALFALMMLYACIQTVCRYG